MSYRQIHGLIGIAISVVFFIGFWIIFLNYPDSFDKSKGLSIAAYPLMGLNDKSLVVFTVFTLLGLLNIIYCIGYLFPLSNHMTILVGKCFLLLSALQWCSFGFLPYSNESHLFLLRVISFNLTNLFGLFVLGMESKLISKSLSIRYYTLSTCALLLVLSILGIMTLENHSFMRTNIMISLYFLWIGVNGMFQIREREN